ncbi:hypothetical protein Ahy_B04g069766 [Arachis hypogaea]|uniref:Serine aminopeptidase S33 domain-containing protein n=1 Tax=Arachis hypogaea TaxID=3818 RepID=A0A444ZDH3_ARAHY|nr:hypothetical protein Ahy_B04g069766 [Arachis hypogaea]
MVSSSSSAVSLIRSSSPCNPLPLPRPPCHPLLHAAQPTSPPSCNPLPAAAQPASPAFYQSYEVNSRGIEIFCKSWLPEASKPKATVFFCIARKIALAGYRVFAMDYPGFGLSQGLHGYIPNFDGLVDDVIEHYSKIKELRKAAETHKDNLSALMIRTVTQLQRLARRRRKQVAASSEACCDGEDWRTRDTAEEEDERMVVNEIE